MCGVYAFGKAGGEGLVNPCYHAGDVFCVYVEGGVAVFAVKEGLFSAASGIQAERCVAVFAVIFGGE